MSDREMLIYVKKVLTLWHAAGLSAPVMDLTIEMDDHLSPETKESPKVEDAREPISEVGRWAVDRWLRSLPPDEQVPGSGTAFTRYLQAHGYPTLSRIMNGHALILQNGEPRWVKCPNWTVELMPYWNAALYQVAEQTQHQESFSASYCLKVWEKAWELKTEGDRLLEERTL